MTLSPTSRGKPYPGRSSPFLVAHRAGNRLDLLHAAAALGLRLVEADVRLFRGRLEVRHLKTLGPLPVYWDRWRAGLRWRRLLLPDVLAATPDDVELVLDLKGPRRRLADLVAESLRPYLGVRPFTVCARFRALLDPFDGLPVRRVLSVGSARQLRSLLGDAIDVDGVAVHERLLDAEVVRELRTIAQTIMTWPVNDLDRARQLVWLGIDGLITDRPELMTRRPVETAA